jgi:hypothetical protein
MNDLIERLMKVGVDRQIPCPDGIAGCLVYHTKFFTNPVCAEAVEKIRDLQAENRVLRDIISKLESTDANS